MPPPEPEDRKRTERHDDDLREREHERRGPERSTAATGARGTDRRATPSRTICSPVEPSVDLEQAPLRRAPDRLHHVPEVEPPEPEVRVRRRARSRTARRPRDQHRAPDRESSTRARRPNAPCDQADRAALRSGPHRRAHESILRKTRARRPSSNTVSPSSRFRCVSLPEPPKRLRASMILPPTPLPWVPTCRSRFDYDPLRASDHRNALVDSTARPVRAEPCSSCSRPRLVGHESRPRRRGAATARGRSHRQRTPRRVRPMSWSRPRAEHGKRGRGREHEHQRATTRMRACAGEICPSPIAIAANRNGRIPRDVVCARDRSWRRIVGEQVHRDRAEGRPRQDPELSTNAPSKRRREQRYVQRDRAPRSYRSRERTAVGSASDGHADDPLAATHQRCRLSVP